VTIGPDGTLYAGNDDFHLYAVDRTNGKLKWSFKTNDQIWSAAAVGEDGTVYFGSNDLQLRAVDAVAAAAAVEPAKVEQQALRWKTVTLGSVVASPLSSAGGQLLMASFDSNAYAHDAASGKLLWHISTREHIYASPAQAPDGTYYLPSADGTLYAFSEEGKLLWTFDTLDAIRSSPAIGGDGTIYFGCGDGRLYALNPDGTRRWSFDTSADDRNDLNASPALGEHAIYIAGEAGKVWSIPYDYCLRQSDARCITTPDEDLPQEGAHLYFLSHGGSSSAEPPETLGVGEAIAFRLLVRSKGDTKDAALDPGSLKVTVTPSVPHEVTVSANGSFAAVVPGQPLAHDTSYTVRVQGDYLVDGFRFGNQVTGGRVGGQVDKTFTIRTAVQRPGAFPLAVSGDRVPVLDLQRLAAPQPVMLPSYNQIGFDFMHLLVGILELDATTGRVLAWVAAARTEGDQVVIDTSSEQRILFPLEGVLSGDSVVFETGSFRVEFTQVDVPIQTMRIGATLDADGRSVGGLSVFGRTVCADVEFYGPLLRVAGLCNPKTDELVILGTALLEPASFGGQKPAGLTVDTPTLVEATAAQEGSVSVQLGGTLPGAEHMVSLLLLDPATGKPYPLNYSQKTTNHRDASGKITGVTLTFEAGAVGDLGDKIKSGAVELVVIHDLFPLARFQL